MFKIVICPSLRKYMASQIACRFRTNSAQNWRIPTIGLLFLTVTNFQLQKQHASTLQQFQDCGNSCSTYLVGRLCHPFACPFGMVSKIACRFRTNSVQNWRIPTIGLLFLTVTNFQLQKQHGSTLQQFHDYGNSVSTESE